jgi:hypothetical protein
MEELIFKVETVKSCYFMAAQHFQEESENLWGLGLTYYNMAEALFYFEQAG